MSGFSGDLTDEQIWTIITWLRDENRKRREDRKQLRARRACPDARPRPPPRGALPVLTEVSAGARPAARTSVESIPDLSDPGSGHPVVFAIEEIDLGCFPAPCRVHRVSNPLGKVVGEGAMAGAVRIVSIKDGHDGGRLLERFRRHVDDGNARDTRGDTFATGPSRRGTERSSPTRTRARTVVPHRSGATPPGSRRRRDSSAVRLAPWAAWHRAPTGASPSMRDVGT